MSKNHGSRFSLANILLLTTLVAIVMAAGRVAVGEFDKAPDFLLAMATFCGAVTGLLVGAVVGVDRERPARGALLGAGWGFAVGMVSGMLLTVPATLPVFAVGSLTLVALGVVIRRFSGRSSES